MSSWDDDEFDVEVKMKEAVAKKAVDPGDDEELEQLPAKDKTPEVAPPAKSKKKKGKGKPQEEVPPPAAAAKNEALEDPVAEKARRQRMVEAADMRVADDLFAGCERVPNKKDTFQPPARGVLATPAIDEDEVPCADPAAEKRRLQKLVEKKDAGLVNELFGGSVEHDDEEERQAAVKALKERAPPASKPKEKKATAASGSAAAADAPAAAKAPKVEIVYDDAFDKVVLKTQADVEQLCSTCCEKIDHGKFKSAAAKFMTDVLKGTMEELKLIELEALEKAITQMVKMKKVDKTAVDTNKRKQNDKLDKNTKFNTSDELAVVYGEGGDEWWEEDDDWYAGYEEK